MSSCDVYDFVSVKAGMNEIVNVLSVSEIWYSKLVCAEEPRHSRLKTVLCSQPDLSECHKSLPSRTPLVSPWTCSDR